MRRRLAVLTTLTGAVVAVAETYRRGYCAPLIFGSCAWLDALIGYRPGPNDEPEPV